MLKPHLLPQGASQLVSFWTLWFAVFTTYEGKRQFLRSKFHMHTNSYSTLWLSVVIHTVQGECKMIQWDWFLNWRAKTVSSVSSIRYVSFLCRLRAAHLFLTPWSMTVFCPSTVTRKNAREDKWSRVRAGGGSGLFYSFQSLDGLRIIRAYW